MTSSVKQWSLSLFRWFIDINRKASRAFDRLLPNEYLVDGNAYFNKITVPTTVKPHFRVYDVGGGSRPCFTPRQRAALALHIIGLDISAEELAAAPPSSYDETIIADIINLTGNGDADLIVCQSVLEHVDDTAAAVQGLSTLLKKGGCALIFVPCGNAAFACANKYLPEMVKRKILFSVLPETDDGHNGFPAHYDRTTPSAMMRIVEQAGLQTDDCQYFWQSAYFQVFLPAHIVWRLWQVFGRTIWGREVCETFSLKLTKL